MAAGFVLGSLFGIGITYNTISSGFLRFEEIHRMALDREFEVNKKHMLRVSKEYADKNAKDLSSDNLRSTISDYVSPYSKIEIFGKYYALYNGEYKSYVIPWDDFVIIRENRETTLKKAGIFNLVSPCATRNDRAYDKEKYKSVLSNY